MKSIHLILFLSIIIISFQKTLFQEKVKEDPNKIIQEFQSFKKTFEKQYPCEKEEEHRFNIYKKNKRAAEISENMSKKYDVIYGTLLRNRNNPDPLKRPNKEYLEMNMTCIPKSAKFSLNQYGDLTEDEFISKFMKINEEKIKNIKKIAKNLEIKSNKKIPEEFNWEKENRQKFKETDFNKAKNFYLIKSSNEDDLKAALVNKGPITIALPGENFRFFKEGIFDYWFPGLCKENRNLLMTVIGYGKYCGVDYWMVKSPFGDFWGENGYFMLRKGINSCQITDFMLWFE